MNAAQRKTLAKIIEMIEMIDLEGLEGDLYTAQQEEQEKFDNLSEGLQQAERGQQIETAANLLQEAVDSLSDAKIALDSAISAIEEAGAS